MVPFFASHPDARLVVVTKASDVRNLLEVEHRGQAILSWSLNTPEVCGQFEINTPTPAERVEAMRQCAAAGYPVRAVIMPIIPSAGWRDTYGAFLRELITTVPLARITLGGICSYDGALSLTESKLGPGNTVSRNLHGSGSKSADGRRRYVVNERIDMYRHLITAIRRLDPELPIALCLEEHAAENAGFLQRGQPVAAKKT
jgi:spore photoproduct lyase